MVLYTSKTHDRASWPQKIKIYSNKLEKSPRASNKKRHFCPFELINRYIMIRGDFNDDQEQFFIFGDKTPVRPYHARSLLKETIADMGLNEKLYDFHSLRIGRMSELVNNFGYTISEAKLAGRWKSSCVFKIYQAIIFSPIFVESLKGYDELWLIGDNFMAETYRHHFLKNKASFFMKNVFEVLPFCKSRHDCNDTNMLSRIRSCLAKAVSEQGKLPKFIVIILDDDLLDYLQHDGHAMLGSWIEWLVNCFTEICRDRKSILQANAVRNDYPMIYWAAPPHHRNFLNNPSRSKLLLSMESVFKLHDEIRIIRMKEIWNYDDNSLVDANGRFTIVGLDKYWQSVDAAVKFNALKREAYLARKGQMKQDNGKKFLPRKDKQHETNFFKKYRNKKARRNADTNSDSEYSDEDEEGTNFARRKLPAPKSYYRN